MQLRILSPQDFAAAARRVVVGKSPDVEGQCPAVGFGQMGKAGHGRAVQTLRDHLIQRQGTALCRTLRVGECDRPRREASGYGAISAALGPVTSGALLGVKRGHAGHVRRGRRRRLDAVNRQQFGGQCLRRFRDDFRFGAGGDRRLQTLGRAHQRSLLRRRREGGHFRAHRGRELLHLAVFTRFDHLAAAHGPGVVHGDVIEQLPGLSGFGLRVRRPGRASTERRDQERERAVTQDFHRKKGHCMRPDGSPWRPSGQGVEFRRPPV